MTKTLEVSDETYNKIKDQLGTDDEVVEFNSLSDLLGEIVFIRTVTHYYTGRYVAKDGHFLVLEDAAWIGDTGRFGDFMKGQPSESLEVEPMGKTLVNEETIVDISPYKELFTVQK